MASRTRVFLLEELRLIASAGATSHLCAPGAPCTIVHLSQFVASYSSRAMPAMSAALSFRSSMPRVRMTWMNGRRA